jgi:hypothetical protein
MKRELLSILLPALLCGVAAEMFLYFADAGRAGAW